MIPPKRARLWAGLTGFVLLLGALAYLRDPPWLLSMNAGFGRWDTDPQGTPFRWISGHASFFVPASAKTIDIPLRTTFDRPHDPPITVTVTIDDRPADRLVLTDASWQHARLVLSHIRAHRNARRIDVRVDRVREEGRGVLVGEITWNAER